MTDLSPRLPLPCPPLFPWALVGVGEGLSAAPQGGEGPVQAAGLELGPLRVPESEGSRRLRLGRAGADPSPYRRGPRNRVSDVGTHCFGS